LFITLIKFIRLKIIQLVQVTTQVIDVKKSTSW
jgi:hypothetical protein